MQKLISILALISLMLLCTAYRKPKIKHRWIPTPYFGYAKQGISHYDFGLRIVPLIGRYDNSTNISLLGGYSLFRHNQVTYGIPYATLRFFFPLNEKTPTGPVLAASVTRYKINGVIDQRFNPEIGYSLIAFSLGYSYSIPIGKNELDWLPPHRITLRFTIY